MSHSCVISKRQFDICATHTIVPGLSRIYVWYIWLSRTLTWNGTIFRFPNNSPTHPPSGCCALLFLLFPPQQDYLCENKGNKARGIFFTKRPRVDPHLSCGIYYLTDIHRINLICISCFKGSHRIYSPHSKILSIYDMRQDYLMPI